VDALAGEHVRTDQIVQRPKRRRATAQLVGERRQAQLDTLDGLACRADARERVEEMDDCLPDLRVGIERHVVGSVIDQPGW
jgi:hypothetical protein